MLGGVGLFFYPKTENPIPATLKRRSEDEKSITGTGIKRKCISRKRNCDRQIQRRHKSRCRILYYGRSQNSRNRVFVEEGEGIRTQAFDPSKLEDPSLIIYAPVRVLGNDTIVTNGDQTDTVYEGLEQGKTFEVSLRSREFEPDAPNYTPRISGVMHVENGTYGYQMSILKSNNGDPSSATATPSPMITV